MALRRSGQRPDPWHGSPNLRHELLLHDPLVNAGVAARHTAFGGYAVDSGVAAGGGRAGGVAGHVIAVNEANCGKSADTCAP
jgi:hypothetical protein